MTPPASYADEIERTIASWTNAFAYLEEDPSQGIVGLRRPQIGAVHSVHGFWSTSEAPATVVMPTGTGKTETMLSLLVSARCPRLLVVVPTDPLRAQLANKFLTLGVLKMGGSSLLAPNARLPIVCTLRHFPRDLNELNSLFESAQVIVTTSAIAGRCEPDLQQQMAVHCPYLFIDEAHHAEAPTWSAFKEHFRGRRIVQFTATPFREDGKPLDGTVVFNYPLKKAQEEGYFRPIHFQPVVEFNQSRSDEAIAEKAIQQLRADFERGHIVMARVDSIARAKHVIDTIYSRYPEFKPVALHTGINSQRERDAIRQQVLNGESRIVVCVDMLGEGFDLPELKIAAFHDIRKTLAVTLQLAGRFTRARHDLGDATFIANIADVDVQDELRKLYSRDPDWNLLLPELSETIIGEQLSLQEFLKDFTSFTTEIPLKSVRPASSTVVYKTRCQAWSPEAFRDGIPAIAACDQVHQSVNHQRHTLVVVTARRAYLPWADVESIFGWEWELYVVIWSPEQQLLFVNGSTNAGDYRALAQAVAGDDVVLIRGQQVFRVFAGVNRLRLQNVGLTEQLGRNIRFTGRMGADVESGIPEVQRRRARKSVLSGTGYENGEPVTLGASTKGRIWSMQRGRVDHLAAWCTQVGAKLLDDAIDPEHVLAGTLDAKPVVNRPLTMPIAVDWPECIYTAAEATWSVLIGDETYSLSQLSIELVEPDVGGVLRFAIVAEDRTVEVSLELFEHDETPDYRFTLHGNLPLRIRRGDRAAVRDATEFFYDDPPILWFADGSSLEGNVCVELRVVHPPFDPGRIEAWDWTGVDIKSESQGREKRQDTIQARVIRELAGRGYNLVVDDDGKGEAADVVAVRIVGDPPKTILEVDFYHCKYSGAATPGERIKDLYEVCGQAQKSIAWMYSHEKRVDLFTHLLRREADRRDAGASTRYEVGNNEIALELREMSRTYPMRLRIFVVQPGLSRGNATREQLELLSVAENYLAETFQIPFAVIASP